MALLKAAKTRTLEETTESALDGTDSEDEKTTESSKSSDEGDDRVAMLFRLFQAIQGREESAASDASESDQSEEEHTEDDAHRAETRSANREIEQASPTLPGTVPEAPETSIPNQANPVSRREPTPDIADAETQQVMVVADAAIDNQGHNSTPPPATTTPTFRINTIERPEGTDTTQPPAQVETLVIVKDSGGCCAVM